MNISISRAGLYARCHRAWWYRYVRGLEPVEEKDARDIGTAYHAGLEEAAGGPSAMIAAAELVRPKNELAWAKARAMIVGYADQPPLDVQRVEYTFAETIDRGEMYPGGELVFVGRIDALATVNFRPVIVERKTTGRKIDEWFCAEKSRALQTRAYQRIAVHAGLTKSDYVLYDVAKRPGLRKLTKKDREAEYPLEHYYQRCLDATEYRRVEITPSPEDPIEELISWAQHMLVDSERDYAPPTESSCRPVGSYRCDYMDVCRGGESPLTLQKYTVNEYRVREHKGLIEMF